MKLARLGDVGREIPVVLHEGQWLDLRPIVPDLNPSTVSSESLAIVARGVDTLPVLAGAASMRVGAAIARPGAVICVGMNYAAHAAESGALPPDWPIIFLKTPNTLAGPNDTVTIPPGSTKTDWEVELGVVIGTRALYLGSPDDAPGHVAGFVAADDLSERSYQLEVSGGQWSKGKCSPGFTPLGPWLVTPDEVDLGGLRLRSWVNGEPRQDSLTADMVFSVNQLIYDLSQYLALEVGDVILTGTPQGVALSGRFPYLGDGDVVEIEIDGLGRQRHEFVAHERNTGGVR